MDIEVSFHEIKAFQYLKVKEEGNDLNLLMPVLKSALWTFITIVITTAACKNSTKQADEPQSIVDVNPAFKSLNDSIRQYPGDASLYLRRAFRLTQENAHELAYTDFLKSWSLHPDLEN
jgi:hypothetical protein